MRISIFGCGYVGLVTGACLAEIGHDVVCTDNNDGKIRTLQEGGVPIYEPTLDRVLERTLQLGAYHSQLTWLKRSALRT